MTISHSRRLAPWALVIAAAAQVACGGDTPPPKAATNAKAPDSPPPSARLPDKAPDSPTASAVRISDEIIKACGISEPDAYFAFDSANVRPDDARVLDQVVKCFTSGPLAGRTIKLVGHADPRGGSDYNMTLGQSRADSVAGYMNKRGMDKAKTESTSRGAMDATGTDDPSWARDRRVDVMLGQ
ncbi:MAG TPA: OmpA family protein [Polyangiaceae bacterium]|nr:OmpA family protein [Polyangiaceae bacterium]